MTREEAIKILTPFREAMINQNGCPISDAVYALDVAIQSLEAWGKVKNDLADLWLEGYSPYTEVMEIIDRHLKEVEE